MMPEYSLRSDSYGVGWSRLIILNVCSWQWENVVRVEISDVSRDDHNGITAIGV
jgi:hypothetical protein